MRLSWLSSMQSAADSTEMDIYLSGWGYLNYLTSVPLDLTSL